MSAPEPFKLILAQVNRAIASPEWPEIAAAWYAQELSNELLNPAVAPPRRDPCGNG